MKLRYQIEHQDMGGWQPSHCELADGRGQLEQRLQRQPERHCYHTQYTILTQDDLRAMQGCSARTAPFYDEVYGLHFDGRVEGFTELGMLEAPFVLCDVDCYRTGAGETPNILSILQKLEAFRRAHEHEARTSDWAVRACQAFVAHAGGYQDRFQWTDLLQTRQRESKPHNNLPPYYALCYTVKLWEKRNAHVHQTWKRTILLHRDAMLAGNTLRFYLSEGGPELTGMPVSSVRLCRDDGFQLCEVPVVGYLRWGMDGNMLAITKELGPEPILEPDPTTPLTEITTDQLAQTMVDMMLDIDQMKLDTFYAMNRLIMEEYAELSAALLFLAGGSPEESSAAAQILSGYQAINTYGNRIIGTYTLPITYPKSRVTITNDSGAYSLRVTFSNGAAVEIDRNIDVGATDTIVVTTGSIIYVWYAVTPHRAIYMEATVGTLLLNQTDRQKTGWMLAVGSATANIHPTWPGA